MSKTYIVRVDGMRVVKADSKEEALGIFGTKFTEIAHRNEADFRIAIEEEIEDE